MTELISIKYKYPDYHIHYITNHKTIPGSRWLERTTVWPTTQHFRFIIA